MSSTRLSRTGMLMVTTFGLGFMRPASGTWGSMPTVVIAGLLLALGQVPVWGTLAWWIYHGALLAVFLIFSAACVQFGSAAEVRFGKKDPGQVVADETAGQCLPLMFLPAHAFDSPFRAAIKPWPAYGLQRLAAGWGVLMDDIAAGIQAAIITQLFARILFH